MLRKTLRNDIRTKIEILNFFFIVDEIDICMI